jgi:hypothetical protein
MPVPSMLLSTPMTVKRRPRTFTTLPTGSTLAAKSSGTTAEPSTMTSFMLSTSRSLMKRPWSWSTQRLATGR